VCDGTEPLIAPAELRSRLKEALGRELVSVTDPGARRAQASVWVGMSQDKITVRLSPLQRPEVWRELTRKELGQDPVSNTVKAVLELFWADAFARFDADEVQDPFCPVGMICVDSRRSAVWPPSAAMEVVDPWDDPYQREDGWDPYWYGSGDRRWNEAYPERGRTPAVHPVPHPPKPQRYAVGLLAGGGVHEGGAFLRYEVNGLRRFRQFDLGLSYLGDRGEPEPFQKARRAGSFLLQKRFVARDFELDLGGSFGVFAANFEGHPVEVRPYLRGLVAFALPLGSYFDLLLQSDLATTFSSVTNTGLIEYALSLGLRHRM
jgi:hypothetical protein